MDIKKAKESARNDIKENMESLIEYIENSDIEEKSELLQLIQSDKEHMEDAIGNITLLYYVFAFSNNKNHSKSICEEISKTVNQNPKIKNIYKIYTDLIEIKDINPNLSTDMANKKNEELLIFLNSV